MAFDYEDYTERINEIKKEYERRLRLEHVIEGIFLEVKAYEYFKTNEKVEVYAYSGWGHDSAYFNLSNVQIDEFIEGVLGPLHRSRNLLWTLAIEGTIKNPIFGFYGVYCTNSENIYIKFSAREGEGLQVCKFIQETCTVVTNEETVRMICE